MAESARLRIEGLADAERAMDNLSKAVGRNVLRRALRKAAEPMRVLAEELAPEQSGTLKGSIRIGSLLNQSQTQLRRKMSLADRTAIELFLGPSYLRGAGGRHGHLVEFGTAPHVNGGLYAGTHHPGTAPQPFLRPAFDAQARPTIERLKPLLWEEIERAAERAARRVARQEQR